MQSQLNQFLSAMSSQHLWKIWIEYRLTCLHGVFSISSLCFSLSGYVKHCSSQTVLLVAWLWWLQILGLKQYWPGIASSVVDMRAHCFSTLMLCFSNQRFNNLAPYSSTLYFRHCSIQHHYSKHCSRQTLWFVLVVKLVSAVVWNLEAL